MPTVLRRLLLWTLICVVSAAPSFLWAAGEYDRGAMVVGVCLFIAAYTLGTSTDAFERFHRRPFVRRTLYIGYGLRMTLSIVYPLGMGADLLPGMLSVSLVETIGIMPRSFAGTLLATCVQGALLNVILSIAMLVVYAFQRMFLRPPEEPRGFAVIPLAQTVRPSSSSAAGEAQQVISP
jgi:hypothetical protein